MTMTRKSVTCTFIIQRALCGHKNLVPPNLSHKITSKSVLISDESALEAEVLIYLVHKYS